MTEKIKGYVFNIEKYHLNDGEGIRTIVFLKGCLCRCNWCSNPESFNYQPILAHHANKCKKCGRCIDYCHKNAISFDSNGNIKINRSLCDACGICVEHCIDSALEIIGKEMYAEEVIKEIKKDIDFYRRSGGGVTLSGGEPCLQPDFSRNILYSCKFDLLTSTAVETSGCCKWPNFWKTVEYADEVMFDLKQTDPLLFKKYVCSAIELVTVKDNLYKLKSLKENVILRYPYIPGYTDSRKNIDTIILWAKEAGLNRIDILPFHQFGRNKYKALDIRYDLKSTKKPEDLEIEKTKQIILDAGLECLIGG